MFTFFRTLRADFGGKVLVLFFLTHFGIKGIALGLANGLSLPFFQQILGVSSNVSVLHRDEKTPPPLYPPAPCPT
jgi:hypothetical protein